MADQTTDVTNNDNLLMSFFNRRAIATLHETTPFFQLADKFPLPRGSGQSMTFHGWRTIAGASSNLDDSSSNSAVSLSSRRVSATIISQGRNVKLTDLLELTSILPPAVGAMQELEQSAAITVDNIVQRAVFKNSATQVGQIGSTSTLILSVLMSSVASAMAANTGTNGSSDNLFQLPAVFGASVGRLSAVSATAPSISARLGPIAFRKGVARLRRFNAKGHGADGRYVAVAHPYALATMYGNSDWKQWQVNYSGGPQATMYKNEAGMVHNVRIIESSNCPRYAVAAHSVNMTPILGRGAIGVTELGGHIEFIIKRPGPQTTSEPYNLNSYVAYKYRGVAATLNPSAGCILFTHELL